MFDKNYFGRKFNRLSVSSISQILTLNIFESIRFSTTFGAIATVLLFSQSVVAQSFEGYCVTQKSEEELAAIKATSLLQAIPEPKVTVTKSDREYTISIDPNNRKKLLLTQAGQKEPVAQMTLAQEGGQIVDLDLGDNDWLWIDRNAVDYVMKVNLASNTPYFELPTKLPELSAQPCHFLRRLFKKCHPGNYSYSSSLGRVFIGGYPTTSWRKRNYLHLESIEGEQKAVPESLTEARFITDVPEWNGALFRQPSGEALFYNGDFVIDLSQDFLKLNNGKKFKDWDIRRTAGGRSFLGKFTGRTNNEPLFLMELDSKPGLMPVYLPEDLNDKWLEPFTFSEDPEHTLFIITRKAIFAEVGRKIQTVVNLPSSFAIKKLKEEDLNYIAQQDNKFILFKVRTNQTKLSTSYLLQGIVGTDKCDTVINFDKPITLKNNSKPKTENSSQ